MISTKAEMRLGKDSRDQIVKEYGLYINPPVQSYINEVGYKVAKVAERQEITYEFVILDTPLVNAFAVPGTVFITRGILELIDDEAELAAVIGHELGHITGFHAVKMLQKAFGYQFLSTFATIAVALYGPRVDDARAYGVLNQATNLVAAGFLSGYGRDFELEADRTGLRYAVLSGYDPEAMISFFRRMDCLHDEEATGIGIFLRTHPETQNRIAQVRRILELDPDLSARPRKTAYERKSQKEFYKVLRSTTAQFVDHFERYQEIIKSMPKSDSLHLGKIEAQSYLDPDHQVRLKVPQRWKLNYGFGGEVLVSFASSDGKAQGKLQRIKLFANPVLAAKSAGVMAGVQDSTIPLTSQEWALSVSDSLKLSARTSREVSYPIGLSYVATYNGHDRIGRPAYFKILFFVQGKKRGDEVGFMLSCAAPEDSYLDYLVDFEQIMRSFNELLPDQSRFPAQIDKNNPSP